MSTYLVINLTIGLLPFLAALYLRLWAHARRVLVAILVVAPPFLIWDNWATARGHWAFNPDHLAGWYVFHLPLEEILFFITVPIGCLLIYHGLREKLTAGRYNLTPVWLVGAVTALLASFFVEAEYTRLVLLLTGSLIGVGLLFDRAFLNSKSYILYLGISFGLFLIFNTWLTALPVVTYGSEFMLGWRVGTIPLEDFFYNFLLVTSYAWVYHKSLLN